MEIAVLGPLEVRRGDQLIQLRRGRPRALLTALVLRVGRAVSPDALLEEVWPGQELTNPLNTLQVQISYLRRVLGLSSQEAPALRTVVGGYLLDVDPAAVDSHRFARAVHSAAARLGTSPPDAVGALRDLDDAFALWRGDPLQDVASEHVAVAEIQRLNELRAVAQEYEMEARLALGQHELLVAGLRRLVSVHPLRERLRAQLALALYRSGRQAEALREIDAARTRLVEELGVDLGPDLQRLRQAVLQQHDELEWRAAPELDARLPPSVTPAKAEPGRTDVARLPAATTRLVGRRREVERVRAALAEHRMVTLTGTGGVGKSRLGLAVAHAEADHRPVWFVELADVADERLVPFELVDAVGVVKEVEPFEALAAGIGAQRGLLVLDTCEHLVDACAGAAHRLLRTCPELAVLATSRQPLAVAGEVAWPVPPLAVPPAGASPDDVGEAESTSLFLERGRAVRPDFVLDESNAADVAAICRMLDGLPLAIELAAAKLSVLSPAAILARLDDRFALLRKVGRAADVRQRSLRAAIQWSCDLLDDEARRFFDRLGAFAGRFSLAAATVAAEGLAADPLELLGAMVDRSLVVFDGDDSYRMLETLRAFAVDRLEQTPDDAVATRARLATWLAEYCEAREVPMRVPGADPVSAELRAEMPNIRAALEWAFGCGGDRAVGVRLVCSLSSYWGAVGANTEANRWLRTALDTEGLDHRRRARLLEGVALHAFSSGDLAVGQAAADDAAGHWTASGSPDEAFASLIYAGLTRRSRRELDAAAATLDRALCIARDRYGDWPLALALYWRAATAADQADDELATGLLDEALMLADRAKDQRAVGSIVHQLGRIALRRGDHHRALTLAEQALTIHETIGWSPGIAAANEAIGRALLAGGRPEEALVAHRRALRRAVEAGAPEPIARALEGVAAATAAAGAPLVAAEALGAATAVRAEAGVPTNATQGRSVDGTAAALRQRLGRDGFATAFQRGQRGGPRDVLASSGGPSPH